MDSVDAALADGRGDAGLAACSPARAIRFLVLRNDIDRVRSTRRRPIATLRARAGRLARHRPRRRSSGPLEIYEVRQPVPLATCDVHNGRPDGERRPGEPAAADRLRPADPATPTVLTGDGGSPGGPRLVTDGLRRAERNVGGVRDNLSQTLTAGEASRQQRPTLDVLPFAGRAAPDRGRLPGHPRGDGVDGGVASPTRFGGSDPSHQPFAGDRRRPGDVVASPPVFTGPVGQWLQVELDTPRCW